MLPEASRDKGQKSLFKQQNNIQDNNQGHGDTTDTIA
jgi:hypothetical protein